MTGVALIRAIELKGAGIGVICIESRRISVHEITQQESLGRYVHVLNRLPDGSRLDEYLGNGQDSIATAVDEGAGRSCVPVRIVRWRAPGNDQTPDQHRNDGKVVSDIGYRARTEAEGDEEYTDQRAQECECLRGKSRVTRPRRPNPGRHQGDEQDDRDHALGDASLVVPVSGDQYSGVDEGSNDEGRGLEEHKAPNRLSHGTAIRPERLG